MSIRFFPLGDTGIQLQFGTEISESTNQSIRIFADYLSSHPIEGVLEWVPAYTTLTIYYKPEAISYESLCSELKEIKDRVNKNQGQADTFVYEIPTLYGGETGPDLSYVATYNGLTEEEVISTHSGKDYLIYMIGFVPGFPYLGGMSKRIAAPRLENPRAKIQVGSVGIAGEQTGIYPLETPGGWRIIGKTPVKLYDPTNKNPILLTSGRYLRFVPIDEKEYIEIEKAIEAGIYEVVCRRK